MFSTASNSSAGRVERFLQLLDKWTEKKGLNVPQIIRLEEMRSPTVGALRHRFPPAHLAETGLNT